MLFGIAAELRPVTLVTVSYLIDGLSSQTEHKTRHELKSQQTAWKNRRRRTLDALPERDGARLRPGPFLAVGPRRPAPDFAARSGIRRRRRPAAEWLAIGLLRGDRVRLRACVAFWLLFRCVRVANWLFVRFSLGFQLFWGVWWL